MAVGREVERGRLGRPIRALAIPHRTRELRTGVGRRIHLPPYRPTALPTTALPPPTEMAAIAALLESRSALAALRRTLPKGGPGVVTCRTPGALRRVLETRLVDAV